MNGNLYELGYYIHRNRFKNIVLYYIENMTDLYEKNKQSIKNYRLKHREKNNEYQKVLQRIYDEKKRYYNYDRQAKLFRNMLRD